MYCNRNYERNSSSDAFPRLSTGKSTTVVAIAEEKGERKEKENKEEHWRGNLQRNSGEGVLDVFLVSMIRERGNNFELAVKTNMDGSARRFRFLGRSVSQRQREDVVGQVYRISCIVRSHVRLQNRLHLRTR